jgi:hypothetical protein
MAYVNLRLIINHSFTTQKSVLFQSIFIRNNYFKLGNFDLKLQSFTVFKYCEQNTTRVKKPG